MALDNYPVHVVHGDYSQPPVLNEPAPPQAVAKELEVAITALTSFKRKVKGTTIRPTQAKHPGIVAVRFVEPDKKKIASQSFNDGMGGAKQDPNAPNDAGDLTITDPGFCFAPGRVTKTKADSDIDDPLVAFNAINTGDIDKVKFELFCKHDKATAFKTVEWQGQDLKKLLTHPIKVGDSLLRGSVKFSELFGAMPTDLKIGGDPDPAFPVETLTVHYSPYQLKVTVEPVGGKTAYPSVAWTYIHVVAHSIKLDWFRLPDEKLALFFPPLRRKRELALYADLTDKREDYNLNGQFPATGDVKKIPLEANRFYREERELQDNSGYEQWKLHWGDGPNVPIQATVLIRNMKGAGVPGYFALGNSWLLWSYKDDPKLMSAEGDGLGPEVTSPADPAPIRDFIDDSQNYLVAQPPDQATPSGKNCHIHRGGKRGAGAVPVFPPHTGALNANSLQAAGLKTVGDMDTDAQFFPFTVEPCATRKWAARSKFHSGAAELGGRTGVIFQPSRMGGDAYKLQVAIACADLYAEMDVADEAVLDAKPANLVKSSGTLEVWRQVHFARYLNDVDDLIDYDLIRRKMERNFLWLKILFKKPEKLKMAAIHDAYEEVRTDANSPLEDYVRAAMLDPAQMAAAAIIKDGDGKGDEHFKNRPDGYFMPFLPWELWKDKMIALKGTWPNAIHWSENYTHPQADYWRDRDGRSAPIADLWPAVYTRTETGAGDPTQVTVTIKPDHTRIDVVGMIAGNTRTLPLPNTPNLDPAGKLLLDPNWIHVYNHLTYSGMCIYRPADTGTDDSDGIPRNTSMLVDVTGNTVPQTLFEDIKAYLQGKNEASGAKTMRQNYRRNVGYQWCFALLSELNSKLIGPGVGGFTVVSVREGVLTNCQGPAGKAMSANVTRTAACIPIMNSNDDTTYHEFLHSLFLNHGHQPDNDLYKLHQNGFKDLHIMKTGQRHAQMDGFLMLRTRGWSFIETDAAGAVPANCYAGGALGALPAPAQGDDTAQNVWWTTNCGGANRTLFGDRAQNRV